jgi:hypothetical protein
MDPTDQKRSRSGTSSRGLRHADESPSPGMLRADPWVRHTPRTHRWAGDRIGPMGFSAPLAVATATGRLYAGRQWMSDRV